MNDAIRSAVIAALSILAVAFAAATLGSTVTTDGGGLGGSGDGFGAGDGEGGPLPQPESGPSPGEIAVPYLSEILTVLLVLGALGLVVYVLVYRREALGLLLALALLFGLAYLFFEVIADWGGQPTMPPVDPGEGSPFGGGNGGGGGDPAEPSVPSALAVLVLLVALAGSTFALFGRSDGEDEANPDAADADAGTADAAAVGRAAGRAADRVGDGGTENEVYRAWREMTGLLDAPDPESRTPGEFADRAVEAGIDKEDVNELTRLFEDVRYGERTASEEYERRAVETFRRIERRYAEEGP